MKLIFFDLDGTLLPGTTASLEIARATGTTAELLELERSFCAGTCTAYEFAAAVATLWSQVTMTTVAKAFSDSPKLKNIETTLKLVRDLGWRSCLITMSPMFFAAECRSWGFDFIHASEFETPAHPHAVGLPLKILSPEDKVRIAQELCREYRTTLAGSVAFGDSFSDLLLFERVGFSVAVNGSEALRSKANIFYEGPDLLAAFQVMLRAIGCENAVV